MLLKVWTSGRCSRQKRTNCAKDRRKQRENVMLLKTWTRQRTEKILDCISEQKRITLCSLRSARPDAEEERVGEYVSSQMEEGRPLYDTLVRNRHDQSKSIPRIKAALKFLTTKLHDRSTFEMTTTCLPITSDGYVTNRSKVIYEFSYTQFCETIPLLEIEATLFAFPPNCRAPNVIRVEVKYRSTANEVRVGGSKTITERRKRLRTLASSQNTALDSAAFLSHDLT
jgi:hypothetical protein